MTRPGEEFLLAFSEPERVVLKKIRSTYEISAAGRILNFCERSLLWRTKPWETVVDRSHIGACVLSRHWTRGAARRRARRFNEAPDAPTPSVYAVAAEAPTALGKRTPA